MRILLVTEDVPAPMLGGAGQHAVVLGNALIDAGHEVHLLGYASDPAVGDNGFKGPMHRGIDFKGARWQEDALGAFVPLARPHMARRIWQSVSGLPGPWDVVHYHGHNPLLGTLVPASWNFVHTLHDQGAECIKRSRFRQGDVCRASAAEECSGCASSDPNAFQTFLSTMSVNALRKGSKRSFALHKAVFVSEFLRRRYCESVGISPMEINSSVVHHFVDVHRLRKAMTHAGPDSGADHPRLRVFMAGRIDATKGFAALLDACDSESLKRLTVTVAGDGPDLPALRAIHEARGVRFLGWMPPEEVLRHAVAADVHVVPSIWEEAFGSTTVEGLCLGKTVFALDRGATPELAVYGEPGQLRLFDGMGELVAALSEAAPIQWKRHERASVQSRLPALMDVYRVAPRAQVTEERLA